MATPTPRGGRPADYNIRCKINQTDNSGRISLGVLLGASAVLYAILKWRM